MKNNLPSCESDDVPGLPDLTVTVVIVNDKPIGPLGMIEVPIPVYAQHPAHFEPGVIHSTKAVRIAICAQCGGGSIYTHLHSLWGDVSPADALANRVAVVNGGRILSAYRCEESKFYVVTLADRSETIVCMENELALLPTETTKH